MFYDMPLYRPPSEAYSLIIQVTLGCSHNKCNFCSMYKSKKFTIKPLATIKEEIDIFRSEYNYVERIFLADGDALIIPTADLKEILKYLKIKFPETKRITLYGSPKSILMKSPEELKELKELGLSMVYMGVESGDDETLIQVNKGVDSSKLLEAGLKIRAAGILLSVTAIAGVAGVEKSEQHATNTGKLIGQMNPDYFGVLSLMVERGTPLYEKVQAGEFNVPTNIEIISELYTLIKNIDAKEKITFRSNHASNYVSLSGDFPKDKTALLNKIEAYLDKNKFKPENLRSL